MSKTMDRLNGIEKNRENNHKNSGKKRGIKRFLNNKILIIYGFILLLILNSGTFFILGKYSGKFSDINSNLDRYRNLLGNNVEVIVVLSKNLKEMKEKISEMNLRLSKFEDLNRHIAELDKQVSGLLANKEVVSFAIKNLTKAKDKLFDQVGDLSADLANLKSEGADTDSVLE